MTVGLGNLLNIGNNAIRANQVGINVTGNNIANVNTVGYTRQSVRFQELFHLIIIQDKLELVLMLKKYTVILIVI